MAAWLVLFSCWTVTVRCLPQLDSLASLRGVPPGFPQSTSRSKLPAPPHRLLPPFSLYRNIDSSYERSDETDNGLFNYPPYDNKRILSPLDRPSTLKLYSDSTEDFVPLPILQSLKPSGTRRGNKPLKIVDPSEAREKHLYFLFDKHDDNNVDSGFVENVRRSRPRGTDEDALTFSLLVQSPDTYLRSPWDSLESTESSSTGTLTAALAARQGGINLNSRTVDQILGLPDPTVRAVFGRSKKDILERLLGLESGENFNINDLRNNPTVLRSLRGMSLARALEILRRDDDDYDPLRPPYGNHLGYQYGNDPYYNRYNDIDDDSYSLGSFLPLVGAATANKSCLFTVLAVILQLILQ